MKRIFLVLICLIFVLTLSACGESINMSTLTEYQKSSFSAELKMSSGSREYRLELAKRGERLFVSVKEPKALAAYTFVLDEKGAGIIADGAEIPLASGGLLPLASLYPLFSVSVAGAWKIEKARPGGVELFVCRGEGITLYIDANSHFPFKIISGETEVDVLSFAITG